MPETPILEGVPQIHVMITCPSGPPISNNDVLLPPRAVSIRKWCDEEKYFWVWTQVGPELGLTALLKNLFIDGI